MFSPKQLPKLQKNSDFREHVFTKEALLSPKCALGQLPRGQLGSILAETWRKQSLYSVASLLLTEVKVCKTASLPVAAVLLSPASSSAIAL